MPQPVVPQPTQADGLPVSAEPTGTEIRGGVERVWWTIVPPASVGFLAWIPFVRYAALTRRLPDWFVAAGYLVATVAMVLLVAATERPGARYLAEGTGALVLALGMGGAIHANLLYRRRTVHRRRPGPVTVVRRERRRRAKARRILDRDPALARDLRIGRPDLPRRYDDGGLVDVNHVPAEVLASALGWSGEEAAAVVEARQQIDGFEGIAELGAYAPLGQHRLDRVADLLVFTRG